MKRALLPLAVVAVGAVVALSGSPDVQRGARLQDTVEELEAENARLKKRMKGLESQSDALAERLQGLEKRLVDLQPTDVRRIALKGGGTDRWALASGAAYVQFLRLSDAGDPVFTIQNAAGHHEVALRAGESHVAVDDRGSELRVHTTTVHRILRDRTGAPAEAHVSVVYEVRTP